jgi:hypothetical protein
VVVLKLATEPWTEAVHVFPGGVLRTAAPTMLKPALTVIVSKPIGDEPPTTVSVTWVA